MPIAWEEVSVAPVLRDGKTVIPDEAIASVKKNTVALKGTAPIDVIPVVDNVAITEIILRATRHSKYDKAPSPPRDFTTYRCCLFQF